MTLTTQSFKVGYISKVLTGYVRPFKSFSCSCSTIRTKSWYTQLLYYPCVEMFIRNVISSPCMILFSKFPPVWIIFSNIYRLSCTMFSRTFLRTIFSAPRLYSTGKSFKDFFADKTFLEHKYLQTKKALFGGLSKTVKSLHLLGASILNIKNPFLISI